MNQSSSVIGALLPSRALVLFVSSILVTTSIVYGLALVLYRLFVSPLRIYPGPKLAACTGWYGAYYDLVADGGGKFVHHIKKLHDTYGDPPQTCSPVVPIQKLTSPTGPIVRITPTEIHISNCSRSMPWSAYTDTNRRSRVF